MVQEGHTVGNHTYHHPDMSSISTIESFKKELDDVRSLYKKITGLEMAWYYRPPQGKYSTQNLKMAQELGYKHFSGVLPMWIGMLTISQHMMKHSPN